MECVPSQHRACLGQVKRNRPAGGFVHVALKNELVPKLVSSCSWNKVDYFTVSIPIPQHLACANAVLVLSTIISASNQQYYVDEWISSTTAFNFSMVSIHGREENRMFHHLYVSASVDFQFNLSVGHVKLNTVKQALGRFDSKGNLTKTGMSMKREKKRKKETTGIEESSSRRPILVGSRDSETAVTASRAASTTYRQSALADI